jgi:o-succinylbenzoate synthase
VKIRTHKLTPYTLPLHEIWRSNRHDFAARTGWLLELEDANGIKGYGDCAPLPQHGTETEAVALTTLEATAPRLVGTSIAAGMELLPAAQTTPAARCALETALLDLQTKQQGMPMSHWLNPDAKRSVKVNAAIGALDDSACQRATAAMEQGYSVLKLKIGLTEPRHELELLTKLCADLPTSIQLRLDANQAWNLTTARAFLDGVHGLPIESLEEPLAQADIMELARLQDQTGITLALDETLAGLTTDDLSILHPLHRISIKPMVLGGLLPALRLGQHAQKLGMEVVVTSTVDSAAGVWASTHLAAALDTDGKLCHGLATGEWLKQDLGTGPDIRHGVITMPATPGLSFTPYA